MDRPTDMKSATEAVRQRDAETERGTERERERETD